MTQVREVKDKAFHFRKCILHFINPIEATDNLINWDTNNEIRKVTLWSHYATTVPFYLDKYLQPHMIQLPDLLIKLSLQSAPLFSAPHLAAENTIWCDKIAGNSFQLTWFWRFILKVWGLHPSNLRYALEQHVLDKLQPRKCSIKLWAIMKFDT